MSAGSNETHSTSLTQIGTNAGGSYSLTATTSESPSTSETGNSITGGYTFTQLATQAYAHNESWTSGQSAYTLSEDGTKTSTLTQLGSHVSGAYSLTDQGTDGYTVTESAGSPSMSMSSSNSEAWGQSVSGTDNYNTVEAGNELSGAFTRTTTGGGTDVLGETGTISQLPYNSTPYTGYTLTESGNYLSGSLSMSESGSDRNSIIEIFDNTSNATAQNGPGIVDYSPVGAPFHVGGLTTAYSGPGITGQLNAAATDAAFNDLGLGLLHEYCWRRTTYVWVADNPERPRRPVLKCITEIVPGDKLVCPSDKDPHGPPSWKTVLRVFKNKPAELWCLKTDRGNEVFPTANHPIYVVERGWTPAAELNPGDPLLSLDGKPVRVASVIATRIVEEVYNLQVAGNRTYFVSDGSEGISLLAHNASAVANQQWNAEEVARILEGIDPRMAAWWNQKQWAAGPLGQAPRIGQIESSGGWFGGRWESGPSVGDPGEGLFGHRPVTINVPDSWTSEEVALYIMAQATGAGGLAKDYLNFLNLKGSFGPGDQSLRAGMEEYKKEVNEGRLRALQAAKAYYQFIGGLSAGGQAVMSINDAFHGEFASALLGLLTVIPGERLTSLFNSTSGKLGITFGAGKTLHISQEAVGALRAMPAKQRAQWLGKLSKAGDEAAAQRILQDIEKQAPTGSKGRYADVGGHHVHAKAGFKGNVSYDPDTGFAISQEYMKSRGWDHSAMTRKQRELFDELARSGRPNTLREHSRIAEEALVAGGATREEARQLVRESTRNLKRQGAT